MSNQVIRTLVPPPVGVPRGAVRIGRLAAALWQVLAAAAKHLSTTPHGLRQAARHIEEHRHA